MTTQTIECEKCGGRGEIPGSEFYRGRYWTIWLPCHDCHETGQITVEDEPVVAETPAPAGTLTVGGCTVVAPGFVSAAQFDSAIKRAHEAGLTAKPALYRGAAYVRNPQRPEPYLTTRTTCTCPAGEHGRPCHHRSFAIFLEDLCDEQVFSREVVAA